LAAGTAALAVGCDSGPSAALSCDLLAGDNCWRTTATAAISCLDVFYPGTLSADGSTCTSPGGNVTTFVPPLVLPLPTDRAPSWNFTVTTPTGAPCLAYQDDGNGEITLTVGSGTTAQTVSETRTSVFGLGVTLTCPDGTSYSTLNRGELDACLNRELVQQLPGSSWYSDDRNVWVALDGTGQYAIDLVEEQETIVSCERALPVTTAAATARP
jgi:hypothetical protein